MAWHATPRLPDIARTKSGVGSLSGAIPPIVASEGNGGRLGNYADRTARVLLADKRLSLGNDPDRERDRHRAHTLFRSGSRGSFGRAPTTPGHARPRALPGLARR